MATIRHRCAVIVGLTMLLSVATGFGAASAQTTPGTYTPGTSVPATCIGNSEDAGTVAIGQTVTVVLCGPFQPGANESISVDGQFAGVKEAAANGTVTIVITVLSTTQSQVNDPITVRTVCGPNTATATGPGQTSATALQTGKFRVVCGPETETGGLAFTGTNVIKAGLTALLLIVIGGALVLAQRRRRSSEAR